MRWPSMTTPEPVTSAGDCFVHGFRRSGRRIVAKTFTTALSASCDMAAVGSGEGVFATTEPAFFVASPAAGGAANATAENAGTSTQPQRKESRVRVISPI